MMSKVAVSRPGDTKFLPGDAVDRQELPPTERAVTHGRQTARQAP